MFIPESKNWDKGDVDGKLIALLGLTLIFSDVIRRMTWNEDCDEDLDYPDQTTLAMTDPDHKARAIITRQLDICLVSQVSHVAS